MGRSVRAALSVGGGPRTIAAAVAVLATAAAVAASAGSAPLQRATGYLAARQAETGAFFTPDHPVQDVGETLAAFVAGGGEGAVVERALGYLRRHGPERAASKPAYAARIVLGLHAAAQDPSSFGGHDYVASSKARYDATTGRYDTNLFANLLAALGPLAAGERLPERAVDYIRANQCAGGGWSWREGCLGPPDADTTAFALNVLRATGLGTDDPSLARARTFLTTLQNPDGGFPLEVGQQTNANSTGLVLSALAALDEAPAGWHREGGDPVQALMRLQLPDGGFRYVATEDEPNDWATVQAIPGLAGVAYPAGPRPSGAPAAPAGDTGPGEGTSAPGPTSSDRPAARSATGDGPASHRAGLAIRFEDGEVRRMCVVFDEPSISGEELLRRAGIEAEIDTVALGAKICRIGPDGCSSGDCFCRYPAFWGYWTRDPGDPAWAFSEIGASDRRVTDGSLDGWSFGPDGQPPPPPTTVDEACSGDTLDAAVSRAAPADPDDPAAVRDGRTSPVGFVAVAGGLATAGGTLWWRRRRAAGSAAP